MKEKNVFLDNTEKQPKQELEIMRFLKIRGKFDPLKEPFGKRCIISEKKGRNPFYQKRVS
jgi:hypothetical protein